MNNSNILIDILKDQVKPALGCTEPGAVAYAVAKAKDLLDEEVKELKISVDKNILKNGMDVGIPGTNEKGIVFAAALSLVIGKPEYILEVLKDVNDKSIEKAIEIIKSKIIKLELKENTNGLYICVEAIGLNGNSKVIIKNNHTNIVFESKNNSILLDDITVQNVNTGIDETVSKEIKYLIKNFTIEELIDFVDLVPVKDLEFIKDGIEMNMRIARVGLSEELGIGIGKYFFKIANDAMSKAKAYTSAASEARMAGYPLPVMSSAGSGNHGLVTIIPLAVIGNEMQLEEDRVVRSIALSHLITIFVKLQLGALSPVCGCGVAAGVGASCGITYLLVGNKKQIMASIDNMIAGITGMICDGAKLGCSYKLSISVDAAVDAANMALKGIYIPSDNGILGDTPEKTIKNLADVSNLGMNNTDNIILDVMLNKC